MFKKNQYIKYLYQSKIFGTQHFESVGRQITNVSTE